MQNFSSADSPGCPPNLSPVGQHGQEHRHRLCAQAVRLAALPGSFSCQLHPSPAPSNRQVTRCPFGLCPVRSPPVLPRCLVSPSSFLPPCVLLPAVLSQRSCDRLMGSIPHAYALHLSSSSCLEYRGNTWRCSSHLVTVRSIAIYQGWQRRKLAKA